MASDQGENAAVSRLLDIMARLRDPQGGCPWDIEQTFDSIAPYTLEEAYEVADAIERGDLGALREELGDLLLQVVYHARMAEEQGAFTFADIVTEISHKLIRRHPHVFGDVVIENATDQSWAWEELKARERASRSFSPNGKNTNNKIEQAQSTSRSTFEPARSTSRETMASAKDLSTSRSTPPAWSDFSTSSPAEPVVSALAEVPLALPALTRAQKLQQRAARVGFDWPDAEGAAAKLDEEWAELRHELAEADDRERLADELGDVLFSCVNLARKLGFDAETVLRHANRKFERRFHAMEALAEPRTGRPLPALSLDEQEALWVEAKSGTADGDEISGDDTG